MKDLTKVVDVADKALDTIDDNILSQQELQEMSSDRHEKDMLSDNWLSKSARPITLLSLLALQFLIVILAAFGYTIPVELMMQHGVLLGGAFSWYFAARKSEKVAAKNAVANIRIERIRAKEEKKEARHERKMEKREQKRGGDNA